MALVNLTRTDTLFQKKSICLFAGELNEGAELGVTTASYHLANLPADAIITNAYIHVEKASNAATTAAATLGTTEGGSQILTGANLKTLGKQGTFVTAQSLTGTGKNLVLNVTITGAATAVGKYKVVVEYVEYRKNTGEYTTFA
jgi:hypothetical protein